MWRLTGMKGHCEAVAQLDMLLFPENCFNETTIRNELKSGARGCVIPEDTDRCFDLTNRVKGYLLSKKKHDMTDIVRIAVRPEYQRQGLGERMLLNTLLAAGDFMLCVAKKNEPAIKLYLKHGFKIEAVIGMGDDPSSHWVMVRRPGT